MHDWRLIPVVAFSFLGWGSASADPGLFSFLATASAQTSTAQNPINQAQFKQIAQSPEWLSALHFFESGNSEIQGGDFFLSPDGPDNAEAELKATLEKMDNTDLKIGNLKQTPYCALPFRRKILENFGIQFKKQNCADLDEFVANIAPKSLTYVYSSAYANNPASMFGHTFIRVNQGRNDVLRDYGVNFSARVPPGELGIIYVPKGLFGLYDGGFEIAPFFRKVLEYNEAESRDLWEYDLNFTEQESKDFVLHLWELRWTAKIKYAFARKNCSYQMVRFLQSIKPELKMTPSGLVAYSLPYLLPGATTKELQKYGQIRDIHFRPSHFRILQHRFLHLNADQKVAFEAATDSPKGNTDRIRAEKDPAVLETLISYFEFLKIEQQEKVTADTADKLRAAQVTRAKVGGETRFPEIQVGQLHSNRPDLAHDTRRVLISQNYKTGLGAKTILDFRLGLHELLDPDDGYEQTFTITGLSATAGYSYERQKLELEKVDLISITSMQSIRGTSYPVSWRLGAGWDSWDEPINAQNTFFKAHLGIGPVFEPISSRLYAGFFVGASSKVDSAATALYWVTPLVEPFVYFRLNSNFKILSSFLYDTSVNFKKKTLASQLGLSAGISKNLEFKIDYKRSHHTYWYGMQAHSISTSLGYFF